MGKFKLGVDHCTINGVDGIGNWKSKIKHPSFMLGVNQAMQLDHQLSKRCQKMKNNFAQMSV